MPKPVLSFPTARALPTRCAAGIVFVPALAAAINAEIARANRTTAAGPPTTLSPLDTDTVLEEWRRRRRELPPAPHAPAPHAKEKH